MSKDKVNGTTVLAGETVALSVERLLARHRVTLGELPRAETLPPIPLKEDRSQEVDQDKEPHRWAEWHKRIAEEAKAAGMEPVEYVYRKREAERKEAKSRALLEMLVHRPFSDNYEKEFAPGPYRPPQPTLNELKTTERTEEARKRTVNRKTIITGLGFILLIIGRIGYLNNWGEKIIGADAPFGESSTVREVNQQEGEFSANFAEKRIAPVRKYYYLRARPVSPPFEGRQVFLSNTREEQWRKAQQVFLATRTYIYGHAVRHEFKLPVPPYPETSSKVVEVNAAGEIFTRHPGDDSIPQQIDQTLTTSEIFILR